MADIDYSGIRSPEDLARLEEEQRQVQAYDAAIAAAEAAKAQTQPSPPPMVPAGPPPPPQWSGATPRQIAVSTEAAMQQQPRVEPAAKETPAATMAPAFRAGAGLPPKSSTPEGPLPPPPPPMQESEGYVPRAAPAQIIPGGMQPYTMKSNVHLGKPVPEDVKRMAGAAAGLRWEAAGKESENLRRFEERSRNIQQAQLQANSDARLGHQMIQAEREQMVNDRVARVERLNQEARGAPEDFWDDKRAIAGMIGLFATVLGGAALAGGSIAGFAAGAGIKGMVDSLISQDIHAKEASRQAAGRAADREMDLLKLHEQELGSREKAIEATRLAYYDNLMQQLEVYKAEHRIEDTDPGYLKMRAALLDGYGQTRERFSLREANDIKNEMVQKYRPPQVVGGAGGQARPSNLVTFNGKTYQMGSAGQMDKAQAKIALTKSVQREVNNILQWREEIRQLNAGPTDYALNPEKREKLDALRGKIGSANASIAKLLSKAEDDSVLRKEEYEEFKEHVGATTEGLGMTAQEGLGKINPLNLKESRAADERLKSLNQRMENSVTDFIAAGGGDEVVPGFTPDAAGNLVPTGQRTGRMAAPPQTLAPAGSLDDRTGKPLTGTSKDVNAERARIFDASVSAADARHKAAQAGGGKKKKKE